MDVEARSEATPAALLTELAAVDIDEALAFGHAWVLAAPAARPDLERYVRFKLDRQAASAT